MPTPDPVAAENKNGAGDRHRYYGYNTSGIPAAKPILGIEVRLDWWLDDTFRNQQCERGTVVGWRNQLDICQRLPAMRARNSNNTDTVGSPSDDWGHVWTLSDLSTANFRVRVQCNSSSSSRDFRLDWIPVKVTYADTYRWTLSGGQFQGEGSPFIATATSGP